MFDYEYTLESDYYTYIYLVTVVCIRQGSRIYFQQYFTYTMYILLIYYHRCYNSEWPTCLHRYSGI